MSPKPPASAKPGKQRLVIGIMLAVVMLGGVVSFLTGGGQSHRPAAKKSDIVTITLPPPPPPPKIEPPKVEPPPDDKKDEIVEEKPVDLTPPDEPAPVDTPSENLGTNITGNGPDMGLTRGGGNGMIGGRKGGLGGTNPYARYSLSAKTTVEEALRRDPATRSALTNGLKVEFWPDSNGRVTRAEIIGASAGSAIDQAVKRVLIGLQTQPASSRREMPPSVKIRITARKPAI